VELYFNGLLNDAIHVLGFNGEDGDIKKFNVMSQVDTVLHHG
jgi:hypothetical protein